VDSEDWHRIATLANTVTDKEMCELDMVSLLHRLFHEEVLEIFTSKSIYFSQVHAKNK
jgi:molecular chaperone Hsp33